MRTLLRKIRFRKFCKAFRFVPAGQELTIFEQHFVDVQLGVLASNYRRADRRHRAMQVLLKEGRISLKLSASLEHARLIQAELRNTKKEFWQAHELAKKAGFAVRDRYTDYLLDPLL